MLAGQGRGKGRRVIPHLPREQGVTLVVSRMSDAASRFKRMRKLHQVCPTVLLHIVCV